MQMRSTTAWKIGLALCLVSLLGLQSAWAKSDVPVPEDMQNSGTYPGIRGILELDGRNVHNCGNILLHITNFGLIGSRPGQNFTFSGAPSAQWPAGSPTEYLWAGGLWLGALKNGEPHVTTGQFAFEFRPGRTDLDRIYQTRELAPGGARKPAPNADDDRDGETDEDWLDGRDNDDDGRIDEDFAAISNQMFFCEYGDTDSNIKLGNPEHEPLELWVQQSSLCWESPVVDDFIGFDFKLINRGFAPLDMVYLGFFADCDIGPREQDEVSEDDYAGFWEGTVPAQLGTLTKKVKVSVGYMFDDDTDEGLSEGYIGLMFLGAQDPNNDEAPRAIGLRNFRFFSGRSPYDQGGDPNNDEERYKVLDGTAPRSLTEPRPGEFRQPQMAKKADDYRMTVSAGPFTIVNPGDTLGFQAALVIGRFFDGLKENAVQAQLTYDGVYLDCDEDPTTGILGHETPICAPVTGRFPIDPCDPDCQVVPQPPECLASVPAEGCIWVNADCEVEAETDFKTGVDGKECLIHWLIGTAPPPPNMRLVTRENQVDVLWDNRSETTPDLRLGVVDFESYRIWRADNWTRPFGTDVNTGPGSGLWMLMGEFDLPRNRIGSDTGLDQVRYRPNIPETAVQYYREWFQAHPFQRAPILPGFSRDQLDTAQALAKGVRYYRFVDPPFLALDPGRIDYDRNPLPCSGGCPEVTSNGQLHPTRCDAATQTCRRTAPPPHSGAHYFYSVSATDHALQTGPGGSLVAAGPGLAGDPNSNFVYVNPPTNALERARYDEAPDEIYVVPNPATPTSMAPWKLDPNNADPTGTKVEFHHLPQTTGKVTIFSLSGDMIKELPFDGRSGSGSLRWDLVSRNGQDVTSGVYLFSVEADDSAFKRFIGKFVVIR